MYWNQYKVTPNKNNDANEYIRKQLDASIQVVRTLFVLAYVKENDDATEKSHRKYFLQRMKIKN